MRKYIDLVENNDSPTNMSRRGFLKTAGATAGGVALSPLTGGNPLVKSLASNTPTPNLEALKEIINLLNPYALEKFFETGKVHPMYDEDMVDLSYRSITDILMKHNFHDYDFETGRLKFSQTHPDAHNKDEIDDFSDPDNGYDHNDIDFAVQHFLSSFSRSDREKLLSSFKADSIKFQQSLARLQNLPLSDVFYIKDKNGKTQYNPLSPSKNPFRSDIMKKIQSYSNMTNKSSAKQNASSGSKSEPGDNPTSEITSVIKNIGSKIGNVIGSAINLSKKLDSKKNSNLEKPQEEPAKMLTYQPEPEQNKLNFDNPEFGKEPAELDRIKDLAGIKSKK